MQPGPPHIRPTPRTFGKVLEMPSPPGQTPQAYRTTAEFDEVTLPAALRREHRTKSGTWGLVRVLEGQLKLTFVDPPSVQIVSPAAPGLLLPEQPHLVEPIGKMRMQVEFYNELPEHPPTSDAGLSFRSRTPDGYGLGNRGKPNVR